MSVSGCGCYCHAAFVDISSNSTRERDRHSRMYIEGSEARKWIFRNRFLECDYRKRKTKIIIIFLKCGKIDKNKEILFVSASDTLIPTEVFYIARDRGL